IGPSCREPKMIQKMIEAGMDLARINCSHSDHDFIRDLVKDIRELSARLDQPVGILLDLSGPKVRTGKLKDGIAIDLIEGKKFTLTNRKIEGDETIVSTNYAPLPLEVKEGDHVLLDDGLIELKVLSTDSTECHTEVLIGGSLKNHQGINLPGIRLSIPALTEKDKADLKVGLECEVDFVALSFVRDAQDILDLRECIGDHWPPPMVIAKLEKPEALDQLDDILQVTDAVMIARGDLGVELPPELVPPAQKLITKKSNAKGKPVITATQMLDSMVGNPRPTRAEASDVANAIFDGTDAVMLSEETATGKFPLEAVRMMERIANSAEASLDVRQLREHSMPTSAYAIAHAACEMSVDTGAKLIVTFTKSGATARLISQLRPHAPVIALTQHNHVYNQLTLLWGTTPLMLTEVSDSISTLNMVEQILLSRGLACAKDNIVITGGLPLAARGPANFVKLSTITPRLPTSDWELKGI
ncbi:MAG: pyruvate kinase, partial [Candidatus Obscuribacterales bacterium]|nr:pyruvate kinase [Candidatus Obscuribacterales bacterium]